MKEVSSDESTKARRARITCRLSEAGSQPRVADSEAWGVFSTTPCCLLQAGSVHILSLMLLDPLHSSENKQQEWLLPVDLVSRQSLCLGLPWVLQKEPSSLLQQSWWPVKLMGRKADPSEKVSRGQRLWKCYRQEPLGQESRILPLGWLVTHTGRVREVKKGRGVRNWQACRP